MTTHDLPPLPQYTCRECHEAFGSNCADDGISCPECNASWCPNCGTWFGGDA